MQVCEGVSVYVCWARVGLESGSGCFIYAEWFETDTAESTDERDRRGEEKTRGIGRERTGSEGRAGKRERERER